MTEQSLRGAQQVRREIDIASGRETLKAVLLTPDHGSKPYPLVIMAGGWCYVKEIVLPQYADEIVRRNIAVLMFDHRNFGESTGKLRQHVDPWEQIEDYRNVVSYAEQLPDIDANRLAIWGISYSGGHALILGAIEPRAKCVVSVVPVVDGYRTLQLVHGYGAYRFNLLKNAILEDRRKRAAGGERAYIPHNTPNPDCEMVTWPFKSSYEFFSKARATFAPRYENRSTLESTELLLNYSVVPFLGRLLATPVLMILAEDDNHTPWELQIEAYNSIPSPRKEIVVLKEVTHIGLYSDNSLLKRAAIPSAEFFDRYLNESAQTRS
jgi:fermentation-respiration switch protein FrsA (DUF1100 family)